MITLLYVPCSSEVEARTIAMSLVEERLIACANIIPKMQSIYLWEGKLCEAQEVLLLLKTRRELVDILRERLRNLHSYTVPCLLDVGPTSINEDFKAWLEDNTRPLNDH